jgi:hypothetical protein
MRLNELNEVKLNLTPTIHQNMKAHLIQYGSLIPCGTFCGAVGSGKTSQACRLLGKYLEIEVSWCPRSRHEKAAYAALYSVLTFDRFQPCFNTIHHAKADMISGYTDDREIWDEIKLEKRLHDKYKLEIELYDQMKSSTRRKILILYR